MSRKPSLLILSSVLPFPRDSGQQQRVYYKIKALRKHFQITFCGPMNHEDGDKIREQLLTVCDQVLILPSRYTHHSAGKVWYRMAGLLYALRTGLKWSNYLVKEVEFSPSRIQAALHDQHYDCALFEYWHAAERVPLFHDRQIPCVLDMHNILWQSYESQLDTCRWIPKLWKRWALAEYRKLEEKAWTEFDGVIAINESEFAYVRDKVPEKTRVFYAPMGTELFLWPYLWQPVSPPRLAYYGGLGSAHNQRDALFCYEAIMPVIWAVIPEAELWLTGSNPPSFLRELSKKDERIKTTGYLDRPQEVLKTMSAVLCPWTGTYGFRSRLVEVMAIGLPVVASSEAVYGMGIEAGRGIFLEETPQQMGDASLRLLQDTEFARHHSRSARAQVEEKFSYEATYEMLAEDLVEFTLLRRKVRTN